MKKRKNRHEKKSYLNSRNDPEMIFPHTYTKIEHMTHFIKYSKYAADSTNNKFNVKENKKKIFIQQMGRKAVKWMEHSNDGRRGELPMVCML